MCSRIRVWESLRHRDVCKLTIACRSVFDMVYAHRVCDGARLYRDFRTIARRVVKITHQLARLRCIGYRCLAGCVWDVCDESSLDNAWRGHTPVLQTEQE